MTRTKTVECPIVTPTAAAPDYTARTLELYASLPHVERYAPDCDLTVTAELPAIPDTEE